MFNISQHSMDQTISQTADSKQNKQKELIKRVIKDEAVQQFILDQIQKLPGDTYEINLAFEKIYLLININKYRQTKIAEDSEELIQLQRQKSIDIQSRYVIKIKKSFPLSNSVRIHLLDGGFQPKISDGRDLFQSVLGKPFDSSLHLLNIIQSLARFDHELHHKNQLFLQMQRIGKFFLGEIYNYHELSQMYSSLTILRDFSQKKSNIYVGITQTHFLVFKQLIDKNQHAVTSPLKHHHSLLAKNEKMLSTETEVTYYKLRLISSAELQCIDTILYNQSQKIIELVLKKYRSIKLYHQSDQVRRLYKFQQPEIFLRGVLKYITKFQPCQISFEPRPQQFSKQKKKNDESNETKEMELIYQTIQQCSDLQKNLQKFQKSEKNEERQSSLKKMVDQINNKYQKIIQYYSARANPYYLIYINKLNTLYLKYVLNNKTPTRKSSITESTGQNK